MNEKKFHQLIAEAFDLQVPPMPNFKEEAEKLLQTRDVKPLPRQAVELDYQQLDQLSAARKNPDLPNKRK